MSIGTDKREAWIGQDRPERTQDAYLTITLPGEMKAALVRAAETEGTSLSRWVRAALVRVLEETHPVRITDPDGSHRNVVTPSQGMTQSTHQGGKGAKNG